MVVIDSSAIVDFLVDAHALPRLVEIVRHSDLHAVSFIDLEVMHALRRMFIGRRITEQRASAAIENFREIPITRYAHDPLLPRIWQLRHNVTAYDAAYVALAEKLNAPLVTRDARLARSSGHRARVEHIA